MTWNLEKTMELADRFRRYADLMERTTPANRRLIERYRDAADYLISRIFRPIPLPPGCKVVAEIHDERIVEVPPEAWEDINHPVWSHFVDIGGEGGGEASAS